MWQSGKSASEIAEKLGGVTRNAVIGKAHRLGLSGRPSPIKKVVKKTTPASKKPLPPKAAAPTKKSAPPPKATPSVKPPAKPVVVPGKPLPPMDTAPLAALANATSRKDGKIISILEVSERLCRWPVGDPKEPGFGYCGADAANGHVYCAEHVAIAFQIPNRKDKKPAAATTKTAAKTEVPDLEDLEVEVEDDEEEEDVVEEDDDDDDVVVV